MNLVCRQTFQAKDMHKNSLVNVIYQLLECFGLSPGRAEFGYVYLVAGAR